MKRIIILLIAASTSLIISIAHAQVQYEIIDITVPNSSDAIASWGTEVRDMNNRGQVVGQYWPAYEPGNAHGYLYENGAVTDFGRGGITAINDRGQLLGASQIGRFIYDNGEYTILDSLDYNLAPKNLNNNNQIVGFIWGGNLSGNHAMLYEDGNITDLGTFGGVKSQANAINDNGDIVGYFDMSNGYRQAFMYQNGQLTNTFEGNALDINNNGQVVGLCGDITKSYWQACLSDNGTEYIFSLGGNGEANAINNLGQVVGRSWTESKQNGFFHAFLYENNVITDLGTLGGSHSIAYAINDYGQIAGRAQNSMGEWRAVVWNPVGTSFPPTVVPEPISSILFVVGGATLGVRRFMRGRR